MVEAIQMGYRTLDTALIYQPLGRMSAEGYQQRLSGKNMEEQDLWVFLGWI